MEHSEYVTLVMTLKWQSEFVANCKYCKANIDWTERSCVLRAMLVNYCERRRSSLNRYFDHEAFTFMDYRFAARELVW